ncbi:MAG: hypothetical protein ACKVT2_16910 [Saprospiraceae bacterium]
MKSILKKFAKVFGVPVFGMLLILPSAPAQEAVATQGGFISTANMLYTFTVGESFISTLNNPAVVVTQGFQQPDKLTVEVQEPSSLFQLQAFPNPTADALTVTYQGTMLHFGLFESAGRLLSTIVPNPSAQQIEISFSVFPAGMYLLRAVSESGEAAGFVRIVKQ